MSIEKRLQQLEIPLPPPTSTTYKYVPVVIHGGIAYTAGQIPKAGPGNVVHAGRVGEDVTYTEACECARLCALHALAWLRQGTGSLDMIERILRINGYVAVNSGFEEMSRVIDAASEVFVKLYGDEGRHVRSVIGVHKLPRNAPVLIEVTAAVRI